MFLCDDDYREGWLHGVVTRTMLDEEPRQVRYVWVRLADGKEVKRAAGKVTRLGLTVDKL